MKLTTGVAVAMSGHAEPATPTRNLAADLFASGGTRVLDHACSEDGSCQVPTG
jgi:hypothetical protein